MKQKYNIACVIGFILSMIVIAAVLVAFYFAVARNNVFVYRKAMQFAMGASLIGFISSLMGVITSKKSEEKGRVLGWIGLVDSVVELIAFAVFLAIVFWIGSGVQMSN